MKSYTMSWKMYGKFYKKGYSVCRQHLNPLLDMSILFDFPLDLFLWLIDPSSKNYGSAHKDFRLSSCGRLVARSATYQGV